MVWDLRTGKCLRALTENIRAMWLSRLRGHRGSTPLWAESVAVSADGRVAVSESSDKTIRVWKVSTGRCLHTLTSRTALGAMESVALSADGRIALSIGDTSTVGIWDASTGECLRSMSGQDVRPLALSGDASVAVLVEEGCTMRVWALDWEYEFPGGATADKLAGSAG